MRGGKALGILALVAAGFLPGMWAPPVYDDPALDAAIRRMSGWGPAAGAFLGFRSFPPSGSDLPNYAYRPLTEASLAANAGLGHPGLRAGNLLLHLAATAAVMGLARALGGSPLWAGAFFGLHPLTAQAVTYVYQRGIVLETLCAFLAMAFYLKGRGSGGLRWRFLSWGAGLMAMTAKETAAMLPLVLAGLEWILREPGEPRSAALKRWLPFLAIPAFLGILAARAGPSSWGRDYGHFEYLLLEIPVVGKYLRLALWPFPLHFFYDRQPGAPGQGARIDGAQTLLWGLLLAGILAWTVFGPRRHRVPRLAAMLFLAPLAGESSVFPLTDIGFNHRCYPSILGAALGFSWALSRLGRRGALLGVLALALQAWGLAAENRAWSSPVRLYRRDVRSAFHLDVAWGDYAWEYLNPGEAPRALRLYRQAVRMPWLCGRTAAGLARAWTASGRLSEARRVCEGALSAFPVDLHPLCAAADLSDRLGDPGFAGEVAGRARAMPELNVELALWLARFEAAHGRTPEAVRVLRRNLESHPGDPRLLEALRRWWAPQDSNL